MPPFRMQVLLTNLINRVFEMLSDTLLKEKDLKIKSLCSNEKT